MEVAAISTTHEKKKSSVGKYIVLAIILIILYNTNPTKSDFVGYLSDRTSTHKWLTSISLELAGIQREDYKLFSKFSFQEFGEGKVVVYGFLKRIYIRG